MRVIEAILALRNHVPLLPVPALRVIEGMLALLSAGAAIMLGWLAVVMVAMPMPWVELYGVVMATPVVIAVTLALLACSLWFTFNAFRGGSTATERSMRDSAR